MIFGDLDRHLYGADGTKSQLLTELTCVMHSMYEEGAVNKEQLLEAVDVATMTTEELREETHRRIKEKSNNDVTEAMLTKILTDAENGNPAAKDLLDMVIKGEFGNDRRRE